jgi:flavodoxin
MAKYLVAYYSWTGNTAKVAKAIAEKLGADIEEIRDAKPRKGMFAFIRSAFEASQQRQTVIAPRVKNPADYDVVVLGSPVWAQNMASPMRAYITREQANVRQAAFFCTLGGAGGKTALAKMAALCRRASIADLQVDDPALKSGAWRGAVDDFARRIQDKAVQAAA